MKRSRTCQCLQELDVPKRSRSTPDLGALRRVKEVLGTEGVGETMNNAGWAGALRLFRTTVCGPSSGTSSCELSATTDAPLFSGGSVGPQQEHHQQLGQGFVVDSIVRSQRCLNEIVILEHEQFIGDESLDCGGGSEAAVLFGEATASSRSLFEDSGDSSDYFCGIDSDEGDACEEDVVYNISAALDGSNTADAHAAAHTLPTAPMSGAGRTLSGQYIEACASVCSSSGSSGDDDTEATTEWTAPSSRISTTAAVPSWCGQRGRTGYLSPAGRVGGVVNRSGGLGWTRAVCSGPDIVKSTGSRIVHAPTVISPPFAAASPFVPDKSCSDNGNNKQGGFHTVSPPWPTMAQSAKKKQSAVLNATTAAGGVAAATETSAGFMGFGSVAGIGAPYVTSASAPSPAAAGFYGGGKPAPGDRSHRHHDPGGGCIGGGRGDAVVALLNVNLDRLHLESAKPSTTRVV